MNKYKMLAEILYKAVQVQEMPMEIGLKHNRITIWAEDGEKSIIPEINGTYISCMMLDSINTEGISPETEDKIADIAYTLCIMRRRAERTKTELDITIRAKYGYISIEINGKSFSGSMAEISKVLDELDEFDIRFWKECWHKNQEEQK